MGTDDDIAGQQAVDGRVGLEGLMGQRRIAGAQDAVGGHLHVQLVPQRGLDVDFGQDAEALVGQGLADPLFCRRHIVVDARTDGVGPAQLIQDRRADHGANRRRQDHHPHAATVLADHEPGERQNDLTGNRWKHAFNRHQRGNAGAPKASMTPTIHPTNPDSCCAFMCARYPAAVAK